MKIMVSACLLGRRCKYNGGDNYDEALAQALEGHDVVPVCPEVAGGLTVPRRPCEIVKGAAECLQIARDERIDLAVLQPRSPSCGVKQVYDGSFSGRRVDGSGVFAALLKENGFRIVEPDDFPEGQ